MLAKSFFMLILWMPQMLGANEVERQQGCDLFTAFPSVRFTKAYVIQENGEPKLIHFEREEEGQAVFRLRNQCMFSYLGKKIVLIYEDD